MLPTKILRPHVCVNQPLGKLGGKNSIFVSYKQELGYLSQYSD